MEKRNKLDMEMAIKSMYIACLVTYKEKNGCKDCPANGKLCHNGSFTSCAPHYWYRLMKERGSDGRENNG